MLAWGLVAIVLAVYCVLDVVTTPRAAVRTLPKPLWLLVVLPPVFGPAAWFLAGRPRRGDRTAPAAPPAAPVAPDDDEDFLRDLRRRLRDPRDEPGAA